MKIFKDVNFKQLLTFYKTKELDNVNLFDRFYTTTETDNSKYDNWKFESMFVWDEFYYDIKNSKRYTSVYFVSGKDSIMDTMVDTGLNTQILTDKIVANKVSGISVGFKNKVEDKLNFKNVLANTNSNYKVI